MRKLMLVLMCATTMTSMAACGAKEPVTPEVTKAVTETKTAEEQEEKRRRRIQAVSRYQEASGAAQDQSKTGRVCGRTGICKESDVGCGI